MCACADLLSINFVITCFSNPTSVSSRPDDEAIRRRRDLIRTCRRSSLRPQENWVFEGELLRSFYALGRKTAFSPRLPSPFNNLPVDIVNVPTFDTFKWLHYIAWPSLVPNIHWLPHIDAKLVVYYWTWEIVFVCVKNSSRGRSKKTIDRLNAMIKSPLSLRRMQETRLSVICRSSTAFYHSGS